MREKPDKNRPAATTGQDAAADAATAAEGAAAQAAEAGRTGDAAPAPAAQPTATPPEPGAAAECAEPSSAEELARLRADLEAAKDRALRAQAELDNYRKRVQRQMDEDLRFANLPLLRDLLPVLDNVHRAIAAAEQKPDASGLLEGVQLVAQQLEAVLARYHCTPIEAFHAPFDPHLHQAIAQQPSAEHPANTVLLVTQPGYQLHDRVIRPSQVIVSTSQGP
jgi:molecular chaperone GrpE